MASRETTAHVPASILAFLTNARPQDATMSDPHTIDFKTAGVSVYRLKGWYFLVPPIALLWPVMWYALFVVIWLAISMGPAERIALALENDWFSQAIMFVTMWHRGIFALLLAWLVTVPLRQRYRAYRVFANRRDTEREAQKPRQRADEGGLAPLHVE